MERFTDEEVRILKEKASNILAIRRGEKTLTMQIHNSDYKDFEGLESRLNHKIKAHDLEVIAITPNTVTVKGFKKDLEGLYRP